VYLRFAPSVREDPAAPDPDPLVPPADALAVVFGFKAGRPADPPADIGSTVPGSVCKIANSEEGEKIEQYEENKH
jgi:hypothetical protein